MSRITALAATICAIGAGAAAPAQAQDVRITTFKEEITFSMGGQDFLITRNQNQGAILTGEFAQTSRACPPHCIQPMIAADGVDTLGELELLTFLQTDVSNNTGLLLDVREPAAFAAGSVPGAVNVPSATLSDENRYRVDILRALGAAGETDNLNFSNALDLVIFAGGAWSPEATHTIEGLIDAGYPRENLHYYRAGMQGWLSFGLTTLSAQTPG